jgi:hypothetical protein
MIEGRRCTSRPGTGTRPNLSDTANHPTHHYYICISYIVLSNFLSVSGTFANGDNISYFCSFCNSCWNSSSVGWKPCTAELSAGMWDGH